MRRGKVRLRIVCAVAGVAVAAFALCAAAVVAQDSAPAPSKARAAEVLASMPQTKRISDVAISPDGTRVAYVVNGKLFVSPVSGGAAVAIPVDGDLPVRDVAWHPDGKRLAFVADEPGEHPVSRLIVAAADGSVKSESHEFKGYVQSPKFSQQGALAFLYIENIPRIAGPLQPMTPLSGEIGEHVYEQRIVRLSYGSSTYQQVTPPDMYVYEYDWTPDGKDWVATAARGSGDANWYVAHLYTIDAATGAMRDIYAPKFQIADPRVSPDGKNVAFIEGLMSDEGSTGGDVFLIPINGGTPTNLTPNLHGTSRAIIWTAFTGLLANQNVDGDSALVELPFGDQAAHTIWTGADSVQPGGSAWAAPKDWPETMNGLDATRIAMIRQSGNKPPEVWGGIIYDAKQITHVNDGLRPAWDEMQNIHWMNADTRVQGWLTQPANYDPQKKYPLVVVVHGGPSAACENTWNPWTTGNLSAMGYFVLCANPRGSYGQGEAFVRGNVKDFGGGDFHDIMAGVDYVLAHYPVDPKRLGMYGHSYGGYMTMWAETKTNRFAAAVAGAGLSDWLSYYGVNDIDEWMMPFFGASIYDDPAVYAKSDPMHFVKNVKTPTLILVGDRDGEVPMEQSVEWWHALEAGHVPAEAGRVSERRPRDRESREQLRLPPAHAGVV